MDKVRIVLKTAVKNFPIKEGGILRAVKAHLNGRGVRSAIVEIEIVGSKRMRSLNSKFMKKDYPTDVLSFPLEIIPSEVIHNIGTIFVCDDIIKKVSREKKISYEEEFFFLVRHGLDHLIGIHHK